MLLALSDLSAEQANSTQKTWNKIVWFLNYAASHPDACVRYYASNMVLHVHSDASYLSAPNSRSRAGGHFTLGFNSAATPTATTFFQRPHLRPMPHHKGSYVCRRRGRNSSHFPQLQGGRPHQNGAPRNGTSPTTHPCSSRQHHRRRIRPQNIKTKTIQSH